MMSVQRYHRGSINTGKHHAPACSQGQSEAKEKAATEITSGKKAKSGLGVLLPAQNGMPGSVT